MRLVVAAFATSVALALVRQIDLPGSADFSAVHEYHPLTGTLP